MQRVREVDLLTMEAAAAKCSGYLPRPTIASMLGKSITEKQAEGLLASDQTTMPIELVRLPTSFVQRMRLIISPRRGAPLPNLHNYRQLIRGPLQDHRCATLLAGVPLECRIDKPGAGLTGTVDTRFLTDSGEPAKVGWHFDGKPTDNVVEYAIINGADPSDIDADRHFGFVPGIARGDFSGRTAAEAHANVVDYITSRREASYVQGTKPIMGFAVQLQPCEALLRVRSRELLHDGIPNILGSIAIMTSMDQTTPFHQFGPSPWDGEG